MESRFGRNDLIFLGIVAAVLALVLIWFYGAGRAGGRVVVTVDGEEYGTYSLSEDQRIEIAGADGAVTNVLVIADGYAHMEEADCPDQLCVHQGRIRRENENLVCLPNRVVVTAVGGEASDVDAVAQ